MYNNFRHNKDSWEDFMENVTIDLKVFIVEALATNKKIEKSLGWEPIVSVEEGLIETYNYFKNN